MCIRWIPMRREKRETEREMRWVGGNSSVSTSWTGLLQYAWTLDYCILLPDPECSRGEWILLLRDKRQFREMLTTTAYPVANVRIIHSSRLIRLSIIRIHWLCYLVIDHTPELVVKVCIPQSRSQVDFISKRPALAEVSTRSPGWFHRKIIL